MNKLIGFSTGSIWRWMNTKNRNELINYLRPLNIQAVELTLGSRDEIYNFNLSEKNINWLRSLPFVSIHAPGFHITAPNSKELKNQLNIIQNLMSLTNAKTVVIHIEDLPPDHILKTIRFPISIENTGPGNYTSPQKLDSFFKSYSQYIFCLDLAHAALISEQETGTLISRFGKKISHTHISGITANLDHQSLLGASPQFYRSLIPALKLNVPFLIEEDIKELNINLLHIEFEAAKQLLN